MATSVTDFLKQNPGYIGAANKAARAQAPASKKGSGNKSWLSSIISEAGGAGGAVGGAAAGAALGSVVPGIGNIVGAIGGGIVGGFTGGFGGRAIENKVRDNEYRLADALKEGAVSGVFGGVGPAFQGARGLGALAKASGTKGIGQGAKVLSGMSDDAARAAAGKAIAKGGAKAGRAISGGEVLDLASAAKQTAGRNASERIGNSWYRSTLGIDDIVQPGKTKPNTIFKADDLAGEARKIGLKGSPADMQRQAAVQYGRFNKQVSAELAKSTTKRSSKELYDNAVKEVSEKLPISIDGVPVRDELGRTLSQITKLSKNGKVDATAIHAFKNSLNVDNAFKKLSGELASPLSAKETVDLALWKEADNWIKELAPAAKELTTSQSRLYGLAQGLGRMTRTPGDPTSIVELGARVASPSIRKVQNAAGRGLMNVGSAQASLGKAPGYIGPIAKGTVARGVANQFMQPVAQDPTQEQNAQAGNGMQIVDNGVLTPDALYGSAAWNTPQDATTAVAGQDTQAPQSSYSLEHAMADISRDPKNAAQYRWVYEQSQKQDKGTQLTAQEKKSQKQAQTALAGLGQLKQLFSQAGGGQDRLPGIFGNVQGMVGKNSKAESYNKIRDSLTTALARAFGETGVLTDQDRAVYKQALPRLEDTPEEAAIKIQYLEDMLAQSSQSSGETDYGTQADLSSILSQYGGL